MSKQDGYLPFMGGVWEAQQKNKKKEKKLLQPGNFRDLASLELKALNQMLDDIVKFFLQHSDTESTL